MKKEGGTQNHRRRRRNDEAIESDITLSAKKMIESISNEASTCKLSLNLRT